MCVCVCRNTIIPEIQATAKAPSVVTMNKAIYLLYAQLAVTYIPAAFIGYACFGTLSHQDSSSFLSVRMLAVQFPKQTIVGVHVDLEPLSHSSDMCKIVGFLRKLILTRLSAQTWAAASVSEGSAAAAEKHKFLSPFYLYDCSNSLRVNTKGQC